MGHPRKDIKEYQLVSTIKIQLALLGVLPLLVYYKADLFIISLKINLFSPWYSWKIAELALNNNHSLTITADICKTQTDIQSLIDVQSSNRCPILKYMADFHFLKSTSNDVTDVYFKWRHTR